MPVESGGGSGSGGGTSSGGSAPRRGRTTAPSAPQGGIAGAFIDFVGGGHSVKYTYVGKDSSGRPIYRFTWQAPSSAHSSGYIYSSRTLALEVNGNNYNFMPPNASGQNPIPGEVEPGTGGTDRSGLMDRAVAKVGDLVARGLITSAQGQTLISNFGGWSDTALTMWISRAGTGNRVSPSVIENTPEGSAQDALGGLYTDMGSGGGGGYGGGGGGGGGAGAIGPVYIEPDKRVVTDFVKGTLVSMVGTVPEHLIGPGVETYMRDHKAHWQMGVDAATVGKAGQEIDPQQSVLEYVRSTREYQIIHKNRPKSEDERTWISDRQEQALQGGLSTSRQENFAITQATAGGDVKDVAEAAGVAEFKATGQMPTFLDNQVRNAITGMMSRVGR
jgi:hypothetical protein